VSAIGIRETSSGGVGVGFGIQGGCEKFFLMFFLAL
jgi:hypothetical protein